jgi:hypothetical protein
MSLVFLNLLGRGMLLNRLASKGQLRIDGNPLSLNDVDRRVCETILDTIRQRKSILCIYPIPSYLTPSLAIAALIVECFSTVRQIERTPRILFYGSAEERDLYLALTVGPNRERISEVFGVVRLDPDGAARVTAGQVANYRITVSRHCILPKDHNYRPQVVIADELTFNAEKFAELMKCGMTRWPGASFVVFSPNPMTKMLSVSASGGWNLMALSPGEVAALPIAASRPVDPLHHVSSALIRVKRGIVRRLILVKGESPAWNQAKEITKLAQAKASTSLAARMVIGMWHRIAAMCVKPSEYDQYKSSSMHSLNSLLKDIREVARREGSSANLLTGAPQAFSDLLDELQALNPKRQALQDGIVDAFLEDKGVVVVLSRRGHRYLVEQAGYHEPDLREVIADDKLRFIAADLVSDAPETDQLIFPSILPRRLMWAYRCAAAPTSVYVAYDFEEALLRWCLRESLQQDISFAVKTDGVATNSATTLGSRSESPRFELNIDAIDWLPDFDDTENIELNQKPTSGSFMEVEFTDGTTLYLPIESSVQVLSDTQDAVKYCRAVDVDEGAQVLVIDQGRKRTLFDLLRDRVDTKTGLSKDLDLVRAFTLLLSSRCKMAGMDCVQLLEKIREAGSAITSAQAVSSWVTGEAFGPSDIKDIERLGNVLKVTPFVEESAAFYRAMQRVRLVHRRVGYELVRLLKRSLFETRGTNLTLKVGDEVIFLDDFVDAIRLKTVKSVKKVSYG